MNPEQFVSYIVNKYYRIGVNHVLVVAFLSEYEYYSEHNEPITDTEYQYITDIQNETIETILQDNYDVTTKTSNGEKVDVVSPRQSKPDIPDDIAYVVDKIVAHHIGCTYDEYCKSVEEKIPQDMRSEGESLSFEKLCD